MKVVDIADELFQELDEPSDSSIPAIAYWLRNNIGELNSRLSTTFALDSSEEEFTPTLCEEEKVIFKKLFIVDYYKRQVKKNLGASSATPVVEITDTGSRIKMVNKNEIAKTYRLLMNDELAELKRHAKLYRIDKSEPRQVAGDDTVSATVYNRTPYNRV
jgi:hypothetical protein